MNKPKRSIPGGSKDEFGAYTKASVSSIESPPEAVGAGIPGVDKSKGVDDLLLEGLYQIQRILSLVKKEIDMGVAERDTVQNLKDVMALLFELKKREKELLDDMSPEELDSFLRKRHDND